MLPPHKLISFSVLSLHFNDKGLIIILLELVNRLSSGRFNLTLLFSNGFPIE
jgi:hypothetical protein